MKAPRPLVFPVIHVADAYQVRVAAAAAFQAHCDGVFLISMDGRDEVLIDMGNEVKSRWPSKPVGINFLTLPATEAIQRCAEAGFEMTWSDNAQVHSDQGLERAQAIAAVLQRYPGHQFFGGVAFKYQMAEPNPGLAASRAHALGFVPTTSGSGTGSAPNLAKIQGMQEALRGGPLAVASGITPENVLEFSSHVSHILVATGVSHNEHEFDILKLYSLMGRLRGAHE